MFPKGSVQPPPSPPNYDERRLKFMLGQMMEMMLEKKQRYGIPLPPEFEALEGEARKMIEGPPHYRWQEPHSSDWEFLNRWTSLFQPEPKEFPPGRGIVLAVMLDHTESAVQVIIRKAQPPRRPDQITIFICTHRSRHFCTFFPVRAARYEVGVSAKAL